MVTSQPITSNISNNQDNTNEIPSSISSQSDNDNTMQTKSIPFQVKDDLIVLPPKSSANISSKDLNLALTEAVGEVARRVKIGNKFTDGLDLSLTMDWASELRPSMRKLRQAMDGLLKTARLMHSVQRLQQDMRRTSQTLSTMYRRDVCFSQAVS